MRTKVKQIDILNEIVYRSLEEALKLLNKRTHIKLYAIVYDEEEKIVETIRVKKTIGKTGKSSLVSQDRLKRIADVYAELKVDSTFKGKTYDEIRKYMNEAWCKHNPQTDVNYNQNSTSLIPDIENVDTINEKEYISESHILYVNKIPFQISNRTVSVAYVTEIRNVEHETRRLFYINPEISFLRMLLDYFFSDFFALVDDQVKINSDSTITRKYNEDGIQFNRRLTRLFFGKMQDFLMKITTFDKFGSKFKHELNNQYYVNSLLEEMDDISALTYENASPFGSILFMNKDVITQKSIIRFAVKFTLEDRIRLGDAKRIRKLLELTNMDRDLYLISDEKEIYGLGEVNWNVLKSELAIRLDFTGLSKYNLVLVRTENESSSEGKLLIEGGRKFYRSDLKVIETGLVSVAFKNPRLGEEGYSSEKFTSLLKNIFWRNQDVQGDYAPITEKIQKLDQIVRTAKDQKQGTMVVITDPETAKQEIKKLSKQSTLIEPSIIDSEYIKFLTAIDGAIYFDFDGNCHAIGVILDGLAVEDSGDSSRGARYNSAHRYLYKLRGDEQKKCIIVIISEDGTVDLIPKLEDEETLLSIAEEIIDMIHEENIDPDKLKEKEGKLLDSELVDCDWLFNIAEAHIKNQDHNGNVKRAIEFYRYGFERAEKSYVSTKRYNGLGICYYALREYREAIYNFEIAIKGSNNNQIKTTYLRNAGFGYFGLSQQLKKNTKELNKAIDYLSQSIELKKEYSIKVSAGDYNTRGRCYYRLSNSEKNSRKKLQLIELSIGDYDQAIKMESEESMYYWNRSLSYIQSGRPKSAIEDLIQAELIKHEDKNIKELDQLFKEHHTLVKESLGFYEKVVELKKESSDLRELLSTHVAKAPESNEVEDLKDKVNGIDEN